MAAQAGLCLAWSETPKYTFCRVVAHFLIIRTQVLCPYIVRITEPRHDKTCIREFPTRPDTNRPAQPQKLPRVLKFRLLNLEILYYLTANNKAANQTAPMRRLICAFVVRIWHKTHFLMARLSCIQNVRLGRYIVGFMVGIFFYGDASANAPL